MAVERFSTADPSGNEVRPWSREYAGRFETHDIESDALKGNPLGDSPVRPLWVYLPPAYDEHTDRRWPSIYVLQGFSGTLSSWHYPSSAFRPTYPELVDEAFASGAAPLVSWCGWTPGLPWAGASSWTHQAPAGTTPISAKRLCPLSTAATGHWRTPPTGASRGSRAADSVRRSPPCCGPTCSGDSPPILGTLFTSTPTCPSSRRHTASFVTTTTARTMRFGRTFAPTGIGQADGLGAHAHLRHGGLLLHR